MAAHCGARSWPCPEPSTLVRPSLSGSTRS
ncbi:hypothetical protein E2C01_067019 [Portunus trituberculatus]|uniref:Uncharacterized protein n=1 Tax=Portunus trituberculatus TaxID=210409 RepID=A0A5B7HTX8_PORTR|nr:hypothetical protein [Portunus trituberculatus]